MVLKNLAASVKVPNVSSCGAPAMVSIRNASAMKIPPATVNGSMLETPVIRCLYTFLPKLSFSPELTAAELPPSWR